MTARAQSDLFCWGTFELFRTVADTTTVGIPIRRLDASVF
jgi:hypothetical protein